MQERSAPPESMALLSYSSLSLSSVLLLSGLALLSFCVNVLAFLSVGWPALRGLNCCKHECPTIIPFTFSLLLLFKCSLSPWSFKYLFSSGKRIFLSFVTSSIGWPPNNKSKDSDLHVQSCVEFIIVRNCDIASPRRGGKK